MCDEGRYVAIVVALLLWAAPAAVAGGSVRAFVLLPAKGRVAAVDVERQRIAHLIAVPAGNGPIAASIDGSRVLVGNTAHGIVTEVDGLSGRHVRTFGRLGRPVAISLLPGSTSSAGLVRARYAVVADATGSVDILDLDRGRIASRVRIRAPIAVSSDAGQLWVASRGAHRVTLYDVDDPVHPRALEQVEARIPVSAMTIDSAVPGGVDVVSRDGRFRQISGISLDRTAVSHVDGRVTGILAGYEGDVWIATGDGRLHELDAISGRASGSMRLPRAGSMAIALDVLLVAYGDRLASFDLGRSHRPWPATALPGRATAVAFAVLP